MTWVVPDWDLKEIVEYAADSAYDGVEFRVESERRLKDPDWEWGEHAHGVSALLSEAERREVRELCEAHDVTLPCVAAGDEMGRVDETEREQHIESAKTNIELAGDLGAPYVRLFTRLPTDDGPEELTDEIATAAASAMDEVGEFARDHDVTPLIATHDILEDPQDAASVADRIETDNYGILYNYDAINDEDFAAVGEQIRHVHVHEDVLDPDYEGIADLIERLHGVGYDGAFSLEVIRHESLSTEELDRAAENLRGHIEKVAE